MPSIVRKHPLLGAKVRQMAESMIDPTNKAPELKPATVLKIPLEQVSASGINLGLSETGTHFCIKI